MPGLPAAQVRQAVSGLDSMLLPAPEAETDILSHPIVTGTGRNGGRKPGNFFRILASPTGFEPVLPP